MIDPWTEPWENMTPRAVCVCMYAKSNRSKKEPPIVVRRPARLLSLQAEPHLSETMPSDNT
jgi:hypothetical protein